MYSKLFPFSDGLDEFDVFWEVIWQVYRIFRYLINMFIFSTGSRTKSIAFIRSYFITNYNFNSHAIRSRGSYFTYFGSIFNHVFFGP